MGYQRFIDPAALPCECTGGAVLVHPTPVRAPGTRLYFNRDVYECQGCGASWMPSLEGSSTRLTMTRFDQALSALFSAQLVSNLARESPLARLLPKR